MDSSNQDFVEKIGIIYSLNLDFCPKECEMKFFDQETHEINLLGYWIRLVLKSLFFHYLSFD